MLNFLEEEEILKHYQSLIDNSNLFIQAKVYLI